MIIMDAEVIREEGSSGYFVVRNTQFLWRGWATMRWYCAS